MAHTSHGCKILHHKQGGGKSAPQTVLITGCSSGIGLATAVLLASDKQKRFKVYATMRNLKSKAELEKAAGSNLNKTLFIRELDATKESTVKSVVDGILRDDGRIDVLVNNAGCTGIDVVDEKPLEWCQAMMDTNYWGVVRATRAVLPAMKKQMSGRIINVASIAGVMAPPFYATYAATKFAVEGFSESIAPVLKDGYNIRVIIVEPGPVKTAIIGRILDSGMQDQTKDLDDTLKGVYVKGMEVMKKLLPTMQVADEIAKLHMDIILSENPHLRYQTTEFINKMVASKFCDPTGDGLLDALKA